MASKNNPHVTCSTKICSHTLQIPSGNCEVFQKKYENKFLAQFFKEINLLVNEETGMHFQDNEN